MKTIKKITIPVAAFAFSLLLTGLAPAATNEPKQTIQQFFESVKNNDIGGALKTLFNGTQISSDGVSELSTGISKALSIYGAPNRFDLVSETAKGPVVVELIYTQSFDALPLVWKFYAYQSSQRWIIINANFNDKTNLLE